MAAYAALVSLSHTLHQILHPPPLNNIIIPREQIEFLLAKVSFLIDFLESYNPSRRSQEIADLETKIVDAAYEAEDIIESNVVDQILVTHNSSRCSDKIIDLELRLAVTNGEENISKFTTLLCEGIQTVLEKFLPIEKEFMKMRDMQSVGDLQPERFATATSSRSLPSGNNVMVGFEEHMTQIIDALATNESNRQIIPIVGMGGIGKTTLATAVYNSPSIFEYFHARAWVTISQEYTVRELLLRLLSEITKAGQNKQESTDDEIGELLYKELFDRRYLIVMDDMWDIEVWDKVKRFLPRNNNGSRILVTTRLSNLAVDFRSCIPHQIGLLDEKRSWDLLSGNVFGKEDCPDELEEIGKNIAKKCRGLPLALVVIGGLLANSERTRKHWEFVAGDVAAALNYGNDEQFMKMLSLSYSHLPIYLKTCFLYLAVFPEDCKIRVSPLVRLWVAEGLIKPNPAKCLEEVALEYLEDLISRNLILVHKRGSGAKVMSCKMHDLVREFCITEAAKEKFVCIGHIETKRRLFFSSKESREKKVIEALQSSRSNRSWLSYDGFFNCFRQKPFIVSEVPSEKMEQVNKIIHGFRLLKVFHMNHFKFLQIRISTLRNLRYVVTSSVSSISSMSLCWNLQTLVVSGFEDISLPAEIWQMPQLRYLMGNNITLPDPPLDDQNVIVLENLQTLKGIQDFKCTEEVFKGIPNLKKLRIAYKDLTRVGRRPGSGFPTGRGTGDGHLKAHHDLQATPARCGLYYDFLMCETEHKNVGYYCLKNLVHLQNLESLGIIGGGKLWTDIALPISLKKLSLRRCKIPWEDLSIVGKLPILEVLKLDENATKGEEWNPIEGEFHRLKYLRIQDSYLKIWRANNSHFPCLEHLVLVYVRRLEKIPKSFAKILTLKLIELSALEDSNWKSARKISEKQELLGYEPLQVRQYALWDHYN